MRARYLLLFLLAVLGAARAQAPQTPQVSADTAPPPESSSDQRIERIHHEDKGASIDELRVGGQTQRITVSPKNGMPAYEVTPSDNALHPVGPSGPSGRNNAAGNAGRSVWKIGDF